MTQWSPRGEVVDQIGQGGDLEAETTRLLKSYGICSESYEDEHGHPFKHLEKEMGKFENWEIPEEEICKRMDLRGERIFSIDPVTARDLDDALSIKKVYESTFEVGVHIADVSYFIPEGSILDKEALKRSTSTYFPHRVLPMLPRILCEQLCSLNSGVDRLAYSVIFRMNLKTGELDPNFDPVIGRSVIRSCAKWNYNLA